MRMHEILGVEPGEVFEIEGVMAPLVADGKGWPCTPDGKWLSVLFVSDVINGNRGLIRKPRLTGEQVELLKALHRFFGAMWLARDDTGFTGAYAAKPAKMTFCWSSMLVHETLYISWNDKANSVLSNLVSWSDPEPLNILDTLRAAGVEV